MPPENETFIQEFKKALADNLTELNSSIDGRFKAQDAKISTLEKSIRDTLVQQHGPREVNKKSWSWARYCAAVARHDWSIAPFEHEECQRHQESVEKTMTAGSFAAGGSFVPPQYIAEVIDLLRAQLILQRLGVSIWDGLTGSPVMVPKITSGSSAFWIAPEGADITPSDLGTGQLNMQPRMCASLVKLSNTLLMLSNPSIEAQVRNDLTANLAREVEKQFFQGTGILGQPVGLINWTPAIPTGDTTWATSDLQRINAVKDVLKKVDTNNALVPNARFAVNPNSYWAIEKLVDANSRHYLIPDPTLPGASRLLGYALERSTLVAPTSGGANIQNQLWFGNWADSILAIWAGLDIAASTETSTAFQKNEMWIRAIMYVDVGVRRELSFCRLNQVE